MRRGNSILMVLLFSYGSIISTALEAKHTNSAQVVSPHDTNNPRYIDRKVLRTIDEGDEERGFTLGELMKIDDLVQETAPIQRLLPNFEKLNRHNKEALDLAEILRKYKKIPWEKVVKVGDLYAFFLKNPAAFRKME
ncbi:RxLR effector protein [Phytophthora megakarya]|uniref:RxLR effector protein n=1 Tax=Phytophthora megakarya TaxID=4795 RepID=A0A225VDX6_9STRA|nr:RxLR effector protein [Phytophthora megakarya]